MAFTPFFQGTDATNLIQGYLNKNITADTPFEPADMNANNVFRNPYSPEGFYANDTDMYPVSTYKPPVNDSEGVPSCEEGYVYDEVLKSCRFVGFSEPAQEQNRDRGDIQERPYMSIEDMENADDYELLNYLTDGYLANSKLGFLPSKLGEDFYLKGTPPNMLSFGLGMLGLNNSKLRNDFMKKELAKRGYNLDTKQGQLGLTQAMGIIDNADSSNLGFTPDEINYQIQAKKNAQNIINQGGNPYANTMTYDQIKDDANKSGGTINPHEVNFTPSPSNESIFSFNPVTNPADNYNDESSGI
jgi:hypothetical protein